jgi:hypothetical protein
MTNSDPPDGGGMPCTPVCNKGVNIFGCGTHKCTNSTFKTDIFATPGRTLPEHRSGVGEESLHKSRLETAIARHRFSTQWLGSYLHRDTEVLEWG